MTPTGPERRRPAFARNFRTLSQRLGRKRDPWGPGDLARYVRNGGLLLGLAGLLILASILFLDATATEWARGLTDAVRAPFRFVTRFGKSEWFLVPAGVLGLVLLAARWDRVGRRVAAAWTEIGAFCLFLFAAVAGSGLTTDLVKWIVGRSRPGRFDTDGVLTFTPFASDAIHYSFPSGHSTTVAAVAVAVILVTRRLSAGVVVTALLAALIAASRVVVRAHFASDVIAGITVGTLFTIGLAVALGRTGVAFQRLPGGGLAPKTGAIRAMLGRKGGWPRMMEGLGRAFSPVRRTSRP